jgi:DHA1 family bicyclomycin/chloramphenicol resistance-like MFS transporter
MAVLLGVLTIFGPISMDLYLPVLPAMTREFGAATSIAQLTVTACLLGLGLGQLIAGPLSDHLGRRRPLLVGVVAYSVASMVCAITPDIYLLVVARLFQGLAGSVGIVIAQAAGRDLYVGTRLVRYYGGLTALGGFAAMVGPVVGALLALVTDWRGIFGVLALIGVLILVLSLVIFRETLPAQRRIGSGGVGLGAGVGRLLRDPVFISAVLITGLMGAALFAYVAAATFVLQDIYGLSPQGYALVFALNAGGVMLAGLVAGPLSTRWSQKTTLAEAIGVSVLSSLAVLASGALHLPLPVMIASLFVMVGGVALAQPPAAAIALAGYPDMAGKASSAIGFMRYGLGGVAAPAAGLGGAYTAVPLGVVAASATTLSGLTFVLGLRRRRAPQPRSRTLESQEP